MVVFGVLSWRATASLHKNQRLLLCGLRVAGMLGLLYLLTNPGKWVQPITEQTSPWLVLVDRSASMNQPLREITRSDQALELLEATVDHADKQDIPIEVRSFDAAPSGPLDPKELPAVDGQGSDLTTSLNQLLAASAASGKAYSGVIVLSDGRQTRMPDEAELASLVLRLNSYRTRFHGVVIGSGEAATDLSLIATRPSITGFAGQNVRIPFVLKSKDMDPVKPQVRLLDEKGEEIASQAVSVSEGEMAIGAFEIPCPESSTRMEIATDLLDGEVISANNRDSLRIQVLDSKTRVFLAEGAPYWDSKFLAQLLRQQSHIELQSVHRISKDRYFHVNSGDEEPAENATIFPESLEELSKYDLVVFGKNTDAFLDPATTSALRTYVRDRGGAVLFSRGRSTTGRHPGLEPLEPVSWNNGQLADFRFEPTQDGAASSLFGEALPAIDDAIWSNLPPLKDARTVSAVKPFGRILANASNDSEQGLGNTTPALIVRRYGQGVTGMMNGDGLWKWDFYPEARELGNMYEDFWVQLIQWMASYSEFMPGHDYALRLSPSSCLPGKTVTLTASYRGSETPEVLEVKVTAPDGKTSTIQPAPMPGSDGHDQWRASFTPDAVGSWMFEIVEKAEATGPKTMTTLEVIAPPTESDNLATDDSLMNQIAVASEGSLVSADAFDGLLSEHLKDAETASANATPVWQSSWPKWPFALLLILPYALEWFLRRRQGLA